MTFIANILNKNYKIIFICLLFYGLSISIFLKELNLILFKDLDFHIINIYRFIIVIFSLYLILKIKKKININLLLYLFIFLLFLYNSLNGQKFNFEIDPLIFYRSINVNYDDIDIFFQNKNKILIICLLNVFLPVFVFSICKDFQIEFEKFKTISLIICNIYLYLLIIFLFYKFIMIKYDINSLEESFINIHSMIYILNINFILIIDKITTKSKGFNFINLLNISLIIICFFLAETLSHLFISLISLIFFVKFFHVNKKYLFFSIILFSILILLSMLKVAYIDFQNLDKYFDYNYPGSAINSLYVRLLNIKYFLFYTENFNIFTGNNIFIDSIYTYPHNIFIDIYVSSGLLGLLIFIFVVKKTYKNLKKNLNKNNFFIFIILFQSFIFSNLSGFLFTNIIFNTSLAACLCLLKEKEFLIIENS